MVDCVLRRAGQDAAGPGDGGLRRRQHRRLDRRLRRASASPSSTSISSAAPGAGGPGPTASTATPTCSPTWPRTRSRSPRPSSRSRSSPTSSCRTAGAGQVPRRRALPARLPPARGRGDPAGARRPARRIRPTASTAASPGAPSVNCLNPRRENRAAARKLTMTIRRGDVFRHELAGRRRLGRPARARPGAGAARRAQRAGHGRLGARGLRGRGRPQAWTVDAAATERCARRSRRRAAGPLPQVAAARPHPGPGRSEAVSPSDRHRHRRHLHRHRLLGAGRRAAHEEGLVHRRRLRARDRGRPRRALRASGLTAAEVGEIRHGTTVASNAILERKGARDRPDHDRGLPRHPGDPHAPHAAALRHDLAEAAGAGRALSAPRGRRAPRPPGPRRDARRPHHGGGRSARTRARHFVCPLPPSPSSVEDALGRVVAEDVVSGHQMPPFDCL